MSCSHKVTLTVGVDPSFYEPDEYSIKYGNRYFVVKKDWVRNVRIPFDVGKSADPSMIGEIEVTLRHHKKHTHIRDLEYSESRVDFYWFPTTEFSNPVRAPIYALDDCECEMPVEEKSHNG